MIKRFLQLSLLITGLGFMGAMSSCQKDYNATTANDTLNTRNPFLGDFTCTMNGSTWTADVKYISDMTFEGTRSIGLSAEKFSYDRDPAVSEIFTLSISPYEGVKNYPINGWTVMATFIDRKKNPAETKTYNAKVIDDASSINMQSDGNGFRGTFSFELKPVGATSDSFNIIVSGGSFDLPK